MRSIRMEGVIAGVVGRFTSIPIRRLPRMIKLSHDKGVRHAIEIVSNCGVGKSHGAPAQRQLLIVRKRKRNTPPERWPRRDPMILLIEDREFHDELFLASERRESGSELTRILYHASAL